MLNAKVLSDFKLDKQGEKIQVVKYTKDKLYMMILTKNGKKSKIYIKK